MRTAVPNSPVQTTGRFAGDGRTPRITTLGQKRRLIDQYAMTKQIVALSAELNQSNRKLKEQQDADAKRRAELEGQLPKEKGLKKLI
ncbi:hypothetical protein TSMEX_002572 [Taenia solium]|eukprot:TsM_001211100 transcript=TsM_001211100 gene=TsM_001211100